ncbi:MAG: DUF6884 domain-containing protein [Candidatus Wenzhouxiangella sp. M2_3B_020]
MSDVTLIQCTNTKRDRPTTAARLYDHSRYFRRLREWARARDSPWYILSARHGLLAPNQLIRPYNERGLSDEQCVGIADALAGDGVATVHVCAGRDYTTPLVPALETAGIDVVNHFAGERIGERERLLKQATARLTHATL